MNLSLWQLLETFRFRTAASGQVSDKFTMAWKRYHNHHSTTVIYYCNLSTYMRTRSYMILHLEQLLDFYIPTPPFHHCHHHWLGLLGQVAIWRLSSLQGHPAAQGWQRQTYVTAHARTQLSIQGMLLYMVHSPNWINQCWCWLWTRMFYKFFFVGKPIYKVCYTKLPYPIAISHT